MQKPIQCPKLAPRLRMAAMAMLCSAALVACGSGGDGLPVGPGADPVGEAGISARLLEGFNPTVDDAERNKAATATLGFGLSLYGAMAETADHGENLVISPLSIAAALGMLLPGTVDEAASELVQAMQMQNADAPHEAIAGLLQAFRNHDATEGVTLNVANRSFVQHGWPIHTPYVETLARWFGDAMATVDFSGNPEAGRATVNDWVAAETNDLIPELMPEGSIGGLTRLVLVNALYLLADWHTQFDPEATREEPFTRRDGSTVPADLMFARHEALPVSQGPGYGAFELAYAGEELALLVIVPDNWNSFAATLDAEQLQAIINGLAPADAEIGLPKLETTTAASLISALRALGVEQIFEPQGGLAGIADDSDLHVAAVQHQTYLRMNEQGTEAAAATGIGVGVTSVPADAVRIIADRPYFLVLRDRTSGGVMFLGRILDPAAS